MAKLSTAEILEVAIRTAAREADPKETSLQVARRFRKEQPEVIEPFAEQWIDQRLALLIGKNRAQSRREANEQLMFEERLGFKRLPARIHIGGTNLRRADATIGILRKLASQLRAEESPRLQEVNNAIALMSKYSTRDKDITWAQVVKREAEKAAK